jgi:hypothetical protein
MFMLPKIKSWRIFCVFFSEFSPLSTGKKQKSLRKKQKEFQEKTRKKQKNPAKIKTESNKNGRKRGKNRDFCIV